MYLLTRHAFRLSFVAAGLLLLVAACAPAPTSQLSASGAWVRATSALAAESTEMTTSPDATPTMESAEAMPAPSLGEAGGMTMSQDAVSAAYLTIRNAGSAADRLVSAATSVAGVVEIHTSEMDSQGVMRMRPLAGGLEIPAGGSVTLEPGSYHLMLMQLSQMLVPGETVTLTLRFASGTTLEVQADVRLP